MAVHYLKILLEITHYSRMSLALGRPPQPPYPNGGPKCAPIHNQGIKITPTPTRGFPRINEKICFSCSCLHSLNQNAFLIPNHSNHVHYLYDRFSPISTSRNVIVTIFFRSLSQARVALLNNLSTPALDNGQPRTWLAMRASFGKFDSFFFHQNNKFLVASSEAYSKIREERVILGNYLEAGNLFCQLLHELSLYKNIKINILFRF